MTHSYKRFWACTFASIAATAALAGIAVSFKAIDDDAVFTVLIVVSAILAIGQLLNTESRVSVFLRSGAMIAVPIFAIGVGMLTVLLIQGDRSRGISAEGPLGYLMVLAASLLFGLVAGTVAVVASFIKKKITGFSGVLPHRLAEDLLYREQVRFVALIAPIAFLLYAVSRGLILQGVRRPVSSQDLLSMYQLAERQNQLMPLLGILDALFLLSLIVGAAYLLLKAMAARRRSVGTR
ncbi:MAG: hypothetical protein HY695_24725 [Deltaproteobacteria bacterium]|nr:hypothetical protein [Deltaproteobacteria bacterium]